MTGSSTTHYPSWGSETASPLCRFDRPSSVSLPLMGIRNVGCFAGTKDVPRACGSLLTTPHGDQKRDSCPLTTRGDRNTLKRFTLHSSNNSLPLMGIRNFFFEKLGGLRKAVAHYPSWGSETLRCHGIQ